jgi:hypothetical protein
MSAAALDRLEASQEALISAFDASEPGAVDAAAAEYREALDEVRAIDFWASSPVLKSRLEQLLRRANDAQMRVNFLTDLVQRRHQALAALRGHGKPELYTRPGA